MYDDWTLALAAYNCGPGNVNKAIKRAGGVKDYWEISNYLPGETRNYVPAYIGAVYIMNYFKEHKIVPLEYDYPLVSDTIMITNKSLSFQQITSVLDISEELLTNLNPQYKKNYIPSSETGLALRLPLEYTIRFLQDEDKIYAYNENSEQSENNGNNQTDNEQLKLNESKYIYYTVQEGDSFIKVTEKYDGVNTEDLRKLNNMSSDARIIPGDIIKIKRL